MKFNRFLYHAGLKGMGVLNYEHDILSGEEDFLKGYLSNFENPIIFDVGANIGRYSKNIIESSSNVKLFSFEPHPGTFKKLQSNLKGYNVELINKAVGKEKGILELYDYVEEDGSSHATIFEGVIEQLHNKAAISHSVEIIDLRSFIDTLQISKINLLKIDTEGNELSVLLGLGDYLGDGLIDAIHFEFNEMNVLAGPSLKIFGT